MREACALPLGPRLTELGKSALPAGLADACGVYPFFCSSPEPKTINQWIADGEAVVMGTGGVATVNYGRGRFAYSTDCWAIRSNSRELTTEYLYRVLQHQLPRIDYAGFEGSGLRHLRKDFVRDLTVDVPQPRLQRRVTTILAALDDAIEQTEALIAKTQQIKAGLMHDLFTRGVTADGQLRPSREQAPELYKESRLGWIPKQWELRPCSQLCSTVIDCKNRTPPITEEGHPVIRTPNVRDGEFVWRELVFTDAASYAAWTARGLPLPGDIVITREAPVGEVCVLPDSLRGACLGQRMMLYRPDPSQMRVDFMLHALQTQPVQKYLDVISGGSTVGHVRVGDIRSLELPWTGLGEQAMVASKLEAVRVELTRCQDEGAKLKAIRLGVMHDLLTGRVRVPVAEEPVAAEA